MVRNAKVTQVPLVQGSGQPPDTRVVYTIGHSTRELDDFIALLERERIQHLADVRSFPGSRRYPQFGREALAASLAAHGMAYSHHPALGGRRHARPDSPNGAWRNESFRGYADYMLTPEFATALDDLVDLAASERTAIMCAEAVPWRCHRSLISDALVARGVDVRHILDARTEPHRMRSFAIVKDGVLYYPPVQTEL
jgi:uncharacterized protein (DUF488 family)